MEAAASEGNTQVCWREEEKNKTEEEERRGK